MKMKKGGKIKRNKQGEDKKGDRNYIHDSNRQMLENIGKMHVTENL